jgi:hypothetical protein
MSSSTPRKTPPHLPFLKPSRLHRDRSGTYIEDPSPTLPTKFPSSSPKPSLLQKAKDLAHWHAIKHSKTHIPFQEVDYAGRRGKFIRWARRELASIPSSPRGTPDLALARREFSRHDEDSLYEELFRGDEARLRAYLDLEGDYPEGRRAMQPSAEDLDDIDRLLYELRKSEEERRERSLMGRLKRVWR